LQLAVEAFNLFNRDNVRAVQTLYGPDPNRREATFGDPAQLLAAARGAAGRALLVLIHS
jgi:hypothetical protein